MEPWRQRRRAINVGLKPGFGLLELVKLCLKSRGTEAGGDRLDADDGGGNDDCGGKDD
jgi:hypothetical protein